MSVDTVDFTSMRLAQIADRVGYDHEPNMPPVLLARALRQWAADPRNAETLRALVFDGVPTEDELVIVELLGIDSREMSVVQLRQHLQHLASDASESHDPLLGLGQQWVEFYVGGPPCFIKSCDSQDSTVTVTYSSVNASGCTVRVPLWTLAQAALCDPPSDE